MRQWRTYLASLVTAYELIVHADGARACGQAQDKGMFRCRLERIDTLHDVIGDILARLDFVVADDQPHVVRYM
jgi:hypothetical protein